MAPGVLKLFATLQVVQCKKRGPKDIKVMDKTFQSLTEAATILSIERERPDLGFQSWTEAATILSIERERDKTRASNHGPKQPTSCL